jgi:ribosome biogenesis GTPase
MVRQRGTVLQAAGGVYEIELDEGLTLPAVLRGRLKLQQRTGDRVVAGDRVTIERTGGGTATIEAVDERRTELARRAPGKGARRAKVIVANVDQVMIVLAAAQPSPKTRLLDRFLVLAESNHLPAVVIVNKADLGEAGPVDEMFSPYEAIGYRVLHTSVPAGQGIEALRGLLCGRTSVLTGPSGVGKSSLLNAIQPGLALRTAAVSQAHHKGRHTTVTAELIPLACGGHVADTPGLRELGLWGIPPEDLPECFVEFQPYLGNCRFARSCSHVHEPGCAIKEAVESAEIHPERYESYILLRREAAEPFR